MSKLQTLRSHRDQIAREANALNAKYPADQRMPAAEAEKLDTLLAQIEAIDAEIGREQRVAQLAAEANPAAQMEQLRNAHTVDPARQDNREGVAALRAYLGGGLSALSAEQRNAMSARLSPDIRAAMSTTTSSEGGFTTAPEYQRTLETAMRSHGAIFDAISTMQTATGTQMLFPTSDPTSEVGEIVGQNAPVTTGETTFGQLALDVFKYSSKKIAIPFELLQDTFIDLESYINSLLAMRLARIQSAHMTTGTGTGQPRGLVTASTVGVTGATGNTTSVTYDALVDMQHSLDPAYRMAPGVAWMMHDSTLKTIRKIKDTSGRPIFVPGYETGVPGGAPDTLLGRGIVINQDMPVMAASAKSILYGDAKKYVRRVVMDLTLFRMTDSAFTLNGQVGFVAFNRVGGNLIDVGGAVKHYANSAT